MAEDGLVQFDSCDSSYDTYLRIFAPQLTHELHACDDCGTCGTRSVLDAALAAGDYILVVEGYAGSEGEYSILMNCDVGGVGFHDGDLACEQTVTGSTAHSEGVAGLPTAHTYSFTLPRGRNIVQFDSCASSYDTLLSVTSADLETELESCDDCGPCGTRTVLDAELDCDQDECNFALIVDGYNFGTGHYIVTMHCLDEQEVDGTVDCDQVVVGSTQGASSSVGRGGADRLYSFSIDYARLVQFDSCASSYDTYMRIMSHDLEHELHSCDDCGGSCGARAVLDADMMPGDYILVVTGSVGHCQCSGRTNNAGEGRDCSNIDAGGHWCYTEPGLCDDGERSGSVFNSEWSYLACYPEAEEGEYSITMNCPGETGFLDGSIRCGETVSGSTQLATSHVGTGAGDHVK